MTILEHAVLIYEETQPETSEKAASEDDIIEFYRYHAETGDAAAQTFMGTMHLEGFVSITLSDNVIGSPTLMSFYINSLRRPLH